MLHKNREEYRIYALRQLGTLVLTLKPKAWTITELSENSLLTFFFKIKKNWSGYWTFWMVHTALHICGESLSLQRCTEHQRSIKYSDVTIHWCCPTYFFKAVTAHSHTTQTMVFQAVVCLMFRHTEGFPTMTSKLAGLPSFETPDLCPGKLWMM